MFRKNLLLALVNLILTFSMLTMVIYAWFSLSDQSDVNAFEVQITSGVDYTYHLTYYTNEAVYRFNADTAQIERYDTVTTSWTTSNEWPTGYHNFTSFGVFINQYDPLIAVNNTYNNIILELRIVLENTGPISFNNTFFADSSLAATAVNQYGFSTSRAYYASEVLQVQQMISTQYLNTPIGTNLYGDLNTQFQNTTTYPKSSFYGSTDTYNRTMILNTLTATNPNETLIIYYNFSYFESKIASFLSIENIQVVVSNMPYILFYQDIKIQIREVMS